jgi:pimeloyl-ACP methyl ester carboxylesterase/DNA-binding CsgD family transcriptional regulator
MIRQSIQFTKSPDGTRVAYGVSGSGPILVKCANWINHLEFDWESPVWKHWFEFLSRHFTLIRYDERGCGLSDWDCPEMSFEAWLQDLEAVVEANELGRFPLLGISQGAAVAIAYAHRHPEKVSHLVLYGGYAVGKLHSTIPGMKEQQELLNEIIRNGWEKENPAFRQFFASLFIPGGGPDVGQWFVELCKTANTDNAMAIRNVCGQIDISGILQEVKVPTLVLHSRDDATVPLLDSRAMAADIPGARFVQLESINHLLLPDEPAWQVFCDEVLHFLGMESTPALPDGLENFGRLTAKERNILALLGEGLSNAGIAQKLFLSEKTIRNHLTRIYDKLGVHTRSEAIVLMRTIYADQA